MDGYGQWLLFPFKSGNKIGRNFPPTFELKFPPSFWAFFFLQGKVLLSLLSKNGGIFDIHP